MSERTPELAIAEMAVIGAIENYSECFFPQIIQFANGQVSEEAIREAIRVLVSEGVIRQRECPYEHAYEYRLNPKATTSTQGD